MLEDLATGPVLLESEMSAAGEDDLRMLVLVTACDIAVLAQHT